jgi:hypothetical protein
MTKNRINSSIVAIIVTIILSGCNKDDTTPIIVDVTDYSVEAHWLKTPKTVDYPVDVFYLYSTA